ncbi:hypothetical protein D1872_267250 [compost metagenome]
MAGTVANGIGPIRAMNAVNAPRHIKTNPAGAEALAPIFVFIDNHIFAYRRWSVRLAQRDREGLHQLIICIQA